MGGIVDLGADGAAGLAVVGDREAGVAERRLVAVGVVGASVGKVEEVLASVERFVAAAPDIELLDVETSWLESERA